MATNNNRNQIEEAQDSIEIAMQAINRIVIDASGLQDIFFSMLLMELADHLTASKRRLAMLEKLV